MNFELGTKCTVIMRYTVIHVAGFGFFAAPYEHTSSYGRGVHDAASHPRAVTDKIEGPASQICRQFTVVKDRTRGTMLVEHAFRAESDCAAC